MGVDAVSNTPVWPPLKEVLLILYPLKRNKASKRGKADPGVPPEPAHIPCLPTSLLPQKKSGTDFGLKMTQENETMDAVALLLAVTVGKQLIDRRYARVTEIPGTRTDKGIVANTRHILLPAAILPGKPLRPVLVVYM